VFSATDIANRALEQERWAREKLARHAGRTLRIYLGPAKQVFAIDADGRLSESDASPDLTLTLSPLRLPALLARPERWDELVAAEGDSALAATVGELALTLPWFVEEVFAKTFGPVLGQRLAELGRRLLQFPDYAGQRFGDSIASYIGNEAQFAAAAPEARVMGREIAALAARVDALALRIETLDATVARNAAAGIPSKTATRIKRGST
jgi:ubiquinone biosynthesis protein UbiJ